MLNGFKYKLIIMSRYEKGKKTLESIQNRSVEEIFKELEDIAPDFLTVGDRCVYVIMKDGSRVAFQGDNASSGVQNLQAESSIDLSQVASVIMPDGTELQVPDA